MLLLLKIIEQFLKYYNNYKDISRTQGISYHHFKFLGVQMLIKDPLATIQCESRQYDHHHKVGVQEEYFNAEGSYFNDNVKVQVEI